MLDTVPHYRELCEAFAQSGCPLCRLLNRSADRYLDAVLWELVNDHEVRAELNQARGYCQQHGWLLVRAGAALGVAILMRDVIHTLLEVLALSPGGGDSDSILQSLLHRLDPRYLPKSSARLVAELSPQRPCPVCSYVQGREEDYVSTLLAHLDGPGAVAELYRTSEGLCLSHFRQALASAPNEQDARTLVAAQQTVWQQLHTELGEFIRKKDGRSRDEPYGAERDSWRRALEAVSGPAPQRESQRQGLTQSI